MSFWLPDLNIWQPFFFHILNQSDFGESIRCLLVQNRVGSEGLFPSLSSHTTIRAVRHTAVRRVESFVVNFGKTK